MSTKGLFDRIATLVEELGVEKAAAATEKAAKTDSQGQSSHPSTKEDPAERDATEGAQSADNTKVVKETVPVSVDGTADATPGNVPKDENQQLGQGVDKAKPTGEDPKNETVTKGKPGGDTREDGQGGTSHPANADFGDKYSADRLAGLSDADLYKLAAELGNSAAADIANGFFQDKAADVAAPDSAAPAKAAASAGAATAKAAAAPAAQPEQDSNAIASEIIVDVVKSAQHQADLVAWHLANEAAALRKQAEAELEDPTAGGEDGEDHGTEEAEGSVDGTEEGGELPTEGGPPPGAEALLGAMGGAPGAEAGGVPGAEMGGPPPGMEGMPADEAIQQLAMALLELGIDPAELAAAASDTGAKIASTVVQYKRAGKFRVEACKSAQQKQARDYMKGYISELLARSQR
jgi:hypothetical protein